jgi:hypothetical protein
LSIQGIWPYQAGLAQHCIVGGEDGGSDRPGRHGSFLTSWRPVPPHSPSMGVAGGRSGTIRMNSRQSQLSARHRGPRIDLDQRLHAGPKPWRLSCSSHSASGWGLLVGSDGLGAGSCHTAGRALACDSCLITWNRETSSTICLSILPRKNAPRGALLTLCQTQRLCRLTRTNMGAEAAQQQ